MQKPVGATAHVAHSCLHYQYISWQRVGCSNHTMSSIWSLNTHEHRPPNSAQDMRFDATPDLAAFLFFSYNDGGSFDGSTLVIYCMVYDDAGSFDGSTPVLSCMVCLCVQVGEIEEPTVNATIIAPNDVLGKVMDLCQGRRGTQTEHSAVGGDRTLLRYTLPLAELAGDFTAS